MAGSRIGRIFRWTLTVVIVVVALVVAAAHFGAAIIARNAIATVLDDLGVEYDGLDTLDVNLAGAKASVGPISVGGDAEATIERISAEVSYSDLFDQHARLVEIVIEGADLPLSRAADGGLRIPGVPPELLEWKGQDEEKDYKRTKERAAVHLDQLERGQQHRVQGYRCASDRDPPGQRGWAGHHGR